MVRSAVLESDENLRVLSMLVMAGDSAEVSILMFAGHELVVPVHFRTSGLSDVYMQGHRCCSCCRLLLTCSALMHELDVFPAASWRMVSVPLCRAILLCTQVLSVTGFQTDDTVVTDFGRELFPAPRWCRIAIDLHATIGLC